MDDQSQIIALATRAAFARIAAALLIFIVGVSKAEAQIEPGKLTPTDLVEGEFGRTVSVSGSTAVVGTSITAATGFILGAAYVFERDHGGPDAWGQVAKLIPVDPESETLFGTSVSISGDTIVVGSPPPEDPGVASGYIFERHQGGLNAWGQVAKVTGSGPDLGDSFGASVSISGDTVIVGGNSGDTTPGTATRGSAYIFARNHGGANVWGEVAKLTASDGMPGDGFGGGVSISGATAIVSSALDSAYIFARDGGGANAWGQVAKLTATDPLPPGVFGRSVAISGGTAVVSGGPGASGEGAVDVFARTAGNEDEWVHVRTLEPQGVALTQMFVNSAFGASVAVDGDIVVVGAPDDDEKGGRQSGSAFVFGRHQGGTNAWGQIVKVAASDGRAGAGFGATVSISGATSVVGAPVGSAYVCDLETLSSSTGACRRAIPVVDDRISMSNLTTACCAGSEFSITATFTNTGADSIQNPFFEVTELTSGNLLQNADGASGGVGATLTPGVGDDALSPGESTTVTFVIWLAVRTPFQFFVRVRGELGP